MGQTMVVPSGDHAGAVKKIGTNISGARRVASARGFDPSMPASINELAPASGKAPRMYAIWRPSGENTGKLSTPLSSFLGVPPSVGIRYSARDGSAADTTT